MILADKWKDFVLLDTGNGEKLEQWGVIRVVRPDPQAIWPRGGADWKNADAVYQRSSSGGGQWRDAGRLPENWTIGYRDLKFLIRPTDFKHMGLFPEQAVNWDWMQKNIKAQKKQIRVLNLFGYTGGASVACSAAGADVCHLDSSKGMVRWAGENIRLNGLEDNPVRYIVDDAKAFVARELRRGRKYDAIVMDPPSYGRGAKGETWKIEKDLYRLVEDCVSLLSDNPLFFIINSYTAGFSPLVLKNILNRLFHTGTVTADEIGLPVGNTAAVLPCGIVGRWLR